MEHAELDRIRTSLDNAHSPEEVFGHLAGTQAEMLKAARSIFRQMAKAVHPDVYQGTAAFDRASSAFKKLAQFWEQVQTRIEHGTYGAANSTDMFEPYIIRTKKCLYTIERLLARGDLCGLYIGSSILAGEKTRRILKVPIKPEDNDLAVNEARILRHLRTSDGYEKQRHFVSQLVDTFSHKVPLTDRGEAVRSNRNFFLWTHSYRQAVLSGIFGPIIAPILNGMNKTMNQGLEA